MAAEGETLPFPRCGRVVFSGSIVLLTAVNKPQWSGFAVPELVAVAGLAQVIAGVYDFLFYRAVCAGGDCLLLLAVPHVVAGGAALISFMWFTLPAILAVNQFPDVCHLRGS